MKKTLLMIALLSIFIVNAQEKSNWEVEIGGGLFKGSLNYQPDETLFNPVFSKWENINQNQSDYQVNDYVPLSSYPMDFNVQFDAIFRYKKYLMIKVGYIYSNTFSIGGKGNIEYENLNTGQVFTEKKEMSYSSSQLNYFIGPIIPIGEKGADVFMGFSLFSPTFVTYKEKYEETIDGITLRKYDMKYKGFFGNCRVVIGMQVPLNERLKLGSEIVYSYFNGMKIKSGDVEDNGFILPRMRWFFTLRYKIK